jgi:glutaredoxin 3
MKIELYTKDGCGHCVHTKTTLRTKNLPFTEYNIPKDISREAVLEKFPGAKTLPVSVVDGEWIGGRDELLKMIANMR